MNHVLSWISQYGYAGLFMLLVFGIVGLPIPDETLLMFSGYLISQSRLHPVWTFLSAFSGSACGISLSYGIGRFLGHGVIYRYGRFVRLRPEHLERVHQWYHRSGELVLAFGYFIPAVRHFSALVAGMSGLEYKVFALFAYAGAVVWVSTFLTIGYLVGDHWQLAVEIVHRDTALVVCLIALVGGAAWWIRSKRSRRKPERLS